MSAAPERAEGFYALKKRCDVLEAILSKSPMIDPATYVRVSSALTVLLKAQIANLDERLAIVENASRPLRSEMLH